MSSTLLIALFAFLFIATLITSIFIYLSMKRVIETRNFEKENMKATYDQSRKDKIDLEDQLQQLQNQERTYKVAYEDWKSKYDLLELKYTNLRKEIETKAGSTSIEADSDEKVFERQRDSKSEVHSITLEIKDILNQHLEALNQIIHPGRKSTKSHTKPAEPLHWILGIDQDTSRILQNNGINTFERVSKLSKAEVRKLKTQFEEIDENIIESWPLQASAIIRSKKLDS